MARLADPFRELRKYDLTVLSAVIVVASVGIAAFLALFVFGGGPSDEQRIRDYFSSARGGGLAPAAAERIRVGACAFTGEIRRGAVYRCALTFDGTRFKPCFAFDEDSRIVSGPGELADIRGCAPLIVDASRRRLVIAK